MILRGEFSAGQHLREAALDERFAVSRTPVRAALAANEKEGLLEYNPNRGFIVRPFHVRDILEAYEMRAQLEGTACRVTAEHGMKLDVERLFGAPSHVRFATRAPVRPSAPRSFPREGARDRRGCLDP